MKRNSRNWPSQRLAFVLPLICALAGCKTLDTLKSVTGQPIRTDQRATQSVDRRTLPAPPARGQAAAVPSQEPEKIPVGIQPLPPGVQEYIGPARFTVHPFQLQYLLPRDYEYAQLKSVHKSAAYTVSEDKSRKYIQPIYCTYEFSQNPKIISFWNTPRPVLSAEEVLRANRDGPTVISVDVTVEKCPETWGEALTIGFGADFLAQRKIDRDKKLAVEEKSKVDQAKYKAQKEDQLANWMKGARAAGPAKDKLLAAQIDGLIKVFETNRDPSLEVVQSWRAKLVPSMIELARSGVAQAAAIPKGEAGRKQFEAWDNGIAYTVLSFHRRLRRAAGDRWLGEDIMTEMWREYFSIYKDQIKERGALDPQFLRKAVAGLKKYEATNPGHPVPAPTFETIQQRRTTSLMPRESLLYRGINSAATTLANGLAIRAKNQQYESRFNDAIKEARREFWTCYETRCAESGVLLYNYSSLLETKDRMHLSESYMKEVMERTGAGGGNYGMLSALLGSDVVAIDDGLKPGCETEYERFLGGFFMGANPNLMSAVSALKERIEGPEFLQVQQCRDRMEYIFRPRTAKGLLQ